MVRTVRILRIEPVENPFYPAGSLRIRFLIVEEGHEVETILEPPITLAHARDHAEDILSRIPTHPLHVWVGHEFVFP